MVAILHCLLKENFIANNIHHIKNFKLNYQLDKQKIQQDENKKNINLTITKIKYCLDMDKLNPYWDDSLDDNIFYDSVIDYIESGECYCYSTYGYNNYCCCND